MRGRGRIRCREATLGLAGLPLGHSRLYDDREMSKRATTTHPASKTSARKASTSSKGRGTALSKSDRALTTLARKASKDVVSRYGYALKRLERY